MFKPVSSILFATNLSDNCKSAFDYAVSLATKYQATIILLHVIEKMPDYAERRLIGLLGQKYWDDITKSHEEDARAALIGKKSSSALIRKALEEFCSQAGIDDDSCGYHSREVVVSDGEVVEEILKQSNKHDADMVIMGARKSFLKDNKIGSHIKEVMRKTKIPVLVVPPYQEKDQEE